MKYLLLSVLLISLVGLSIPNVFAESVPDWVKNTAGWWATDAISEAEFVNAIEFLINEEIIQISNTISGKDGSEHIPEWIKNNAGWWAGGQINDHTFVLGLEWLLANGIIVIEKNLIQTDSDFRVAFIGDQGNTMQSIAVLNLIKNEGAQMVLHQGDFDYGDNPDGWDKMISDVLGSNFPYFASIGQHDELKWNGYQEKLYDRLKKNPNAECIGDLGVKSSCTYKGLFFILAGPGMKGSGHSSFIENELNDNDHIWRICSWAKNMHYIQTGEKPDKVGWEVYENCKNGGAIIATAHEHVYSRTKSLINIENQIVDYRWSEPDKLRVKEGSTFVFVSGLGGKSIRDQNRCLPDFYPYGCNEEWAKIYTSNQGAEFGALFCTFNVDGQPNNAECYFKNINGGIVDEFTVTSFIGIEDVDSNLYEIDLSDKDLSNRDLSGMILVDIDFTDVNLTGAKLTGADLSLSNLAGADLSGMDLTGTKLRAADLTGVNLDGTILTGTNLSNSILTGVDLTGVDLSGTILRGADLTNTNLTGVDLSDRDLTETILSGMDLSGKDLTGTKLRGADITNVNFTGTILTGADLSLSNLAGADLTGVDLTETILRGADLTNVNFTGTILTGADLSLSNLAGADLSGVDLSGTILTGADLTNTNLIGVDLSNTILTSVDLTGVDLSGTILTGADLTYTNLAGVDLSGMDLTEAIFDHASFADANLENTNLTRASFVDVDLTKIKNKSLAGTNWFGASFAHSNLSGINLDGAILDATNFNNATLSGLDFTVISGGDLIQASPGRPFVDSGAFIDADLSNSNFEGVDLSPKKSYLKVFKDKAHLISDGTPTPEAKAMIKDFLLKFSSSSIRVTSTEISGNDVVLKFVFANIFVRANLENANFKNADLTLADFGSANLTNADLEGANLSRSNLNNANLEGAILDNATLPNTNLKCINHSICNS